MYTPNKTELLRVPKQLNKETSDLPPPPPMLTILLCFYVYILQLLFHSFWRFQYLLQNKVNSLTTNVPHHIDTSQLICNANQLTGFYMIWGRLVVNGLRQRDAALHLHSQFSCWWFMN